MFRCIVYKKFSEYSAIVENPAFRLNGKISILCIPSKMIKINCNGL